VLSQMALVKNSRLSVCPVTRKEWDKTLKAAGA
jgi:predicted RNA-binding protein with PUA-like domain